MSPKKAKPDAEARRIGQARKVAAQADHITELLDRLEALRAQKDAVIKRLREQLRAEQQAAATRIAALTSRAPAPHVAPAGTGKGLKWVRCRECAGLGRGPSDLECLHCGGSGLVTG